MSRVIGKPFILFVIVVTLSGASFLSPKQAIDPGPGVSGLKQYTAGGHVLGFRENGGQWEITAKSQEFKKVDASTIEFTVPVAKNGKAEVTYTVDYRW